MPQSNELKTIRITLKIQEGAGAGRKGRSTGSTFVLKLLGIGVPSPALPIL